MMRRAAAFAAVAAATAGAIAFGASAGRAALADCGTVTTHGHTFHVAQVGLTCPSALSLTKKLAGMGLPAKPTPYPGTYLKLSCFGVAHGKQAQIQCTGGGGKKTLLAVAR